MCLPPYYRPYRIETLQTLVRVLLAAAAVPALQSDRKFSIVFSSFSKKHSMVFRFTSLFDGDGAPNAGTEPPKPGFVAANPPNVGTAADDDDETVENAFEPKIGLVIAAVVVAGTAATAAGVVLAALPNENGVEENVD